MSGSVSNAYFQFNIDLPDNPTKMKSSGVAYITRHVDVHLFGVKACHGGKACGAVSNVRFHFNLDIPGEADIA